MKKKLVIVASRSIFEFMPQDAKDYDKALLWRGIAQTVGFTANSNPKWSGSLTEFLGKTSQAVHIEIYAKPSGKLTLKESHWFSSCPKKLLPNIQVKFFGC